MSAVQSAQLAHPKKEGASDRLRTALIAAARGWPVIPCRGKVPILKHGLHEASTDPTVIRGWWSRSPNANVAIPTGRASGVYALDIDGEDGEEALSALEREHGPLPQTVEVLTGKGRHLYFRHVEGLRNTAKRLGSGIDTRGDGGYVVIPPSIHPDTGRPYEWSVDGHPNHIRPADLPAWILERLQEPKNGTATPPEEWRALAANGVGEGRRNDAAARLAGHLLRRWVDPYLVLELVAAWNEARCQPPLPRHEIERTVNSIARRELERRGTS